MDYTPEDDEECANGFWGSSFIEEHDEDTCETDFPQMLPDYAKMGRYSTSYLIPPNFSNDISEGETFPTDDRNKPPDIVERDNLDQLLFEHTGTLENFDKHKSDRSNLPNFDFGLSNHDISAEPPDLPPPPLFMMEQHSREQIPIKETQNQKTSGFNVNFNIFLDDEKCAKSQLTTEYVNKVEIGATNRKDIEEVNKRTSEEWKIGEFFLRYFFKWNLRREPKSLEKEEICCSLFELISYLFFFLSFHEKIKKIGPSRIAKEMKKRGKVVRGKKKKIIKTDKNSGNQIKTLGSRKNNAIDYFFLQFVYEMILLKNGFSKGFTPMIIIRTFIRVCYVLDNILFFFHPGELDDDGKLMYQNIEFVVKSLEELRLKKKKKKNDNNNNNNIEIDKNYNSIPSSFSKTKLTACLCDYMIHRNIENSRFIYLHFCAFARISKAYGFNLEEYKNFLYTYDFAKEEERVNLVENSLSKNLYKIAKEAKDRKIIRFIEIVHYCFYMKVENYDELEQKILELLLNRFGNNEENNNNNNIKAKKRKRIEEEEEKEEEENEPKKKKRRFNQ